MKIIILQWKCEKYGMKIILPSWRQLRPCSSWYLEPSSFCSYVPYAVFWSAFAFHKVRASPACALVRTSWQNLECRKVGQTLSTCRLQNWFGIQRQIPRQASPYTSLPIFHEFLFFAPKVDQGATHRQPWKKNQKQK